MKNVIYSIFLLFSFCVFADEFQLPPAEDQDPPEVVELVQDAGLKPYLCHVQTTRGTNIVETVFEVGEASAFKECLNQLRIRVRLSQDGPPVLWVYVGTSPHIRIYTVKSFTVKPIDLENPPEREEPQGKL